MTLQCNVVSHWLGTIALASHLCTCVLHRQLCYLHTLKLPKFFNFHGDFHQKWHFAHPEFSFAHPELPFLAKSMLGTYTKWSLSLDFIQLEQFIPWILRSNMKSSALYRILYMQGKILYRTMVFSWFLTHKYYNLKLQYHKANIAYRVLLKVKKLKCHSPEHRDQNTITWWRSSNVILMTFSISVKWFVLIKHCISISS